MARNASTYRQARRAAWLADEHARTWREFNSNFVGGYDIKALREPVGSHFNRHDRSKYMPHIGAKRRAKGEAA